MRLSQYFLTCSSGQRFSHSLPWCRMLRQNVFNREQLLIVRRSAIAHKRVQPLNNIIAPLCRHSIDFAVQCLRKLLFLPFREFNIHQRVSQTIVRAALHLYQNPFIPAYTVIDILRRYQQIRSQPFQLADKPKDIVRIVRMFRKEFDC